LKLLKKSGIGFRQWDRAGFELAGALFEVLIDVSLVIEIEGDRAVNPGKVDSLPEFARGTRPD
jgi:hypothetical protein